MKNIAPIHLRIIAFFIDLAIFILPFFLMCLCIFQVTKIEDLLNTIMWSIAFLLISQIMLSILIYIVAPIQFGGSPGKYLSGLEIVNFDNTWLNWKQSFIRHFIGYPVSSLLLWAGFFWAFKDKNKQTWHDILSSTIVIQKRKWFSIGLATLGTLIIIFILLTQTIVHQMKNNVFMYIQVFKEIEKINNLKNINSEPPNQQYRSYSL